MTSDQPVTERPEVIRPRSKSSPPHFVMDVRRPECDEHPAGPSSWY